LERQAPYAIERVEWRQIATKLNLHRLAPISVPPLAEGGQKSLLKLAAHSARFKRTQQFLPTFFGKSIQAFEQVQTIFWLPAGSARGARLSEPQSPDVVWHLVHRSAKVWGGLLRSYEYCQTF
jgi:hypothetical protein